MRPLGRHLVAASHITYSSVYLSFVFRLCCENDRHAVAHPDPVRRQAKHTSYLTQLYSDSLRKIKMN